MSERRSAGGEPLDARASQPAATTSVPSSGDQRGGAFTVGAGILLTRLFGLLRDRTLAHFFGVGPLADVFTTALRSPNLLQNLLGEQALSASFIPIYSQLLAAGRERDAGRFAGAIFGLLLALTSGLTLLGMLAARPIAIVLVPGYLADAAAGSTAVDRFELAVLGLRLGFPMAGLLVLAAWCLGILNSHRRFFLPYFAPVLWNSAIVAALLLAAQRWRGETQGGRLLLAALSGAVIGAALQFLVQLPLVWRLSRGLRPSLTTTAPGVRDAITRFVPALAGRGVVQLSSYVDQFLASFLAAGALGAIGWALRLYTLPVSLFGGAVAAAELPELSRLQSSTAQVGERLRRAWRQMVFLTLPTAVGYVALGFVIVGGIYRTGQFSRLDNWLVYLVLAAYSLGLVPSTSSRVLQNTFFALGDTRTPARVATARLVISAGLGGLLMWPLDRLSMADLVGVETTTRSPGLGAVGLALAAAVGGWVELGLLSRRLRSRLDEAALPWSTAAVMLAVALAVVVPTLATWWLLAAWPPLPLALVMVAVYAALYVGVARALRLPEATAVLARLGVRRRR